MKTFYILRNSNKLLSNINAMQVFENLENLKLALTILTTTDRYWTIYKLEREAISDGQLIEIDPAQDQAAILHVFQLDWEIFFQPIDQFPPKLRASIVHLTPKPDAQNLAVLYKLLGLESSTATCEQNFYIAKINTFLTPHFKQNQWQEIFALRLNNAAYLLLCQYPHLSRPLLENTARAAGETAQLELSNSTKLTPLFQGSASQALLLVDRSKTPVPVLLHSSTTFPNKSFE